MASDILKVPVDQDTLEALRQSAVSERRPLNWQAEVLLKRALGLPFPFSTVSESKLEAEAEREAVSHAAR